MSHLCASAAQGETAARGARDPRAARTRFERLGSELWSAKARAELARIGGRPPSEGELTPSERRIAGHVAEGKTNREVAAILVVSERTIEGALTQIYRKVNPRSRTELARKLTSPD